MGSGVVLRVCAKSLSISRLKANVSGFMSADPISIDDNVRVLPISADVAETVLNCVITGDFAPREPTERRGGMRFSDSTNGT